MAGPRRKRAATRLAAVRAARRAGALAQRAVDAPPAGPGSAAGDARAPATLHPADARRACLRRTAVPDAARRTELRQQPRAVSDIPARRVRAGRRCSSAIAIFSACRSSRRIAPAVFAGSTGSVQLTLANPRRTRAPASGSGAAAGQRCGAQIAAARAAAARAAAAGAACAASCASSACGSRPRIPSACFAPGPGCTRPSRCWCTRARAARCRCRRRALRSAAAARSPEPARMNGRTAGVSRRRLPAPGGLEGVCARGAAAGEGVQRRGAELRLFDFAQLARSRHSRRACRSSPAGWSMPRRAASATGSSCRECDAPADRGPEHRHRCLAALALFGRRRRQQCARLRSRARLSRARCLGSCGPARRSPAGCCCTPIACPPGPRSERWPSSRGASRPRAAGGWLPGRAVRAVLALVLVALVLARFHTLNGLAAGTTLLMLMAALKLLEMRRPRDQWVMVGAGLFLLLAACLDRQELARVPLYALQAWAVLCGAGGDRLAGPRRRRRAAPRRARPASGAAAGAGAVRVVSPPAGRILGHPPRRAGR